MPPTQNYTYPSFPQAFPSSMAKLPTHSVPNKSRLLPFIPPQIAVVLKRPYKRLTTLCRNAAYGQKTAHPFSNLSPHLWFCSNT